ncbi:MAG: CehA/McbA family metallohydrolase [Bryobacteraceae bacterium]
MPGKPHLLSWRMRVEGEKSWRFRARFAGITVSFYDDAGTITGVQTRHTHCYRTLAEQPAWILLDIPPRSARLQVAFSIVSEDPLPGRFWVGGFKLTSYDPASRPPAGMAALALIPCLEDGAPTPARLSVQDGSGKPVVLPYTFSVGNGQFGFHISSPRVNRFFLPPGTYEVSAMKGFEYQPVRKTVALSAGDDATLRLVLERPKGLPAGDWRPGDHHVHLFRHGGSIYPFMNLEDVYAMAQGEGLAFVGFMGEDQVPPSERLRERPGFLGWVRPELTRDLWGHLCPIGFFEWPRIERHNELWPMSVDWMDAAQKAGGAIAFAHPGLNEDILAKALTDPRTGHAARELPIAAALGRRFAIDILTEEGSEADFAMKLRDYFRLLNLGFRLGASGSTDIHADQGRQPPGSMRTYVNAYSLTWRAVAQAYREGRTFATNGPLLALSVGGDQPGDVVKLSPGASVDCGVQAFSHWGISQVTLWHNGEAVKRWTTGGGSAIRGNHTLKISSSGWILATVKGPASKELAAQPERPGIAGGQFAITSPVYVEVPGVPLRPDRSEAEYFAKWVDDTRTGFEAVAKDSPLPVQIHQQVLARLARARAVFDQKARQSR